ncbi:MAG: hypothetical protein QM831_35555 [Kofleriaceae bacterium]
MKKFMLLLAVVASVAGCPKKKGGADDAIAQMEKFKTDMCACKDAACAKDVQDKMMKWSTDHKGDKKEADSMTDEQKKKAAAISEELGKCMMSITAPATPPPATPPAGSGDMGGSAAAGSAAPAGSGDMAGSAAGSAAAGSAAK